MSPRSSLMAALIVASVQIGCHDALTGQQARGLVAKGAVLVDVRSPEEFAAGHNLGPMGRW